MKSIISVLKRILSKDLPKPVGRWNIEHCNIKMNQKVDLSNEDHCGPCGQYALVKIDEKKSQNMSTEKNQLANDIENMSNEKRV